MEDVWAWMLFFIMIVGVCLTIISQLVSLMDLELDNINAYDLDSLMKKWVLSEFITQGLLCFLFLVTGHWIMALLSIPYLFYNIRLYIRREPLIDVTEIFNVLDREKKKRIFKLGYTALLLSLSLFWWIYSALDDDFV